MNQENLLNKIRQKDAKAFTHGGKFHADDIFSSALLLYLNPEIQIKRDSICGIRTFVGRVGNGDSWRRTGRKI